MSNNLTPDETTESKAPNVEKDPVLLRAIYAVVFYLVYALSRFVIAAVAIVQFVHVFFTDETQADLLQFANSLTRYAGQLVGYITWASHVKPFPFTEWPSDKNTQSSEKNDH